MCVFALFEGASGGFGVGTRDLLRRFLIRG